MEPLFISIYFLANAVADSLCEARCPHVWNARVTRLTETRLQQAMGEKPNFPSMIVTESASLRQMDLPQAKAQPWSN